jgi:predicted protein tyrosine phosphatase
MMKTILVFGEPELAELVKKGERLPDHLVSIGNPRAPWERPEPGTFLRPEFRGAFRRILRLSFYDVTDRSRFRVPLLARIPALRDARRVVDFWRRTHEEASGYVVHCWAGVARSTAAALALLYLETGDADEAARLLRETRPQAQPNRLFVRQFDRVLGAGLEERGLEITKARVADFAAELDSLLEELPAAEES